MTAMAAGMLVLTGIAPGQHYLGPILIGEVLTALGMGFGLVPSTIVAMQGVAGAQSGVASGLLNTSRLMGGALGLAILSTIASGQTRGALGASPAQALTDGFGLAFTVAIAFAVIAALVGAYGLRPGSERADVVDLPEPVDADTSQAMAA
jgi:hypothetical protein